MQIYNNYMASQMVRYGITSFLKQKTKKRHNREARTSILYPIGGLYSFHW